MKKTKGKSGDKIAGWRKREGLADKRTKFLRLGYTQNPRDRRLLVPDRKTKSKLSRRGGKKKCKEYPHVISPETLLKKEVAEKPAVEEIAPLDKGIDVSPCAGSSCAACNECE